MGVITSFDKVGNALKINYCPTRAVGFGIGTDFPQDSKVYFKVEDRQKVNVFPNVPDSRVSNNVPIGYTISNLEYIVSVVSPPESYVSKMMSAVNSSQGLAMDIKTFNNYRFNLSTLNGLTNQLIPARAQRAYSIMSVPLNNVIPVDNRITNMYLVELSFLIAQ